jgi:hypothetical protein
LAIDRRRRKVGREGLPRRTPSRLPTGDENLDQQISILSHLDLAKLDGVALSPLDAEGQPI